MPASAKEEALDEFQVAAAETRAALEKVGQFGVDSVDGPLPDDLTDRPSSPPSCLPHPPRPAQPPTPTLAQRFKECLLEHHPNGTADGQGVVKFTGGCGFQGRLSGDRE